VTDFLRVNGVPLAVSVESAELRPEVVGESGRAVDGTFFAQRTAIKRAYEASTAPLTAQEALAVEGLVHGKGHVWPFSAALDLYSSRGALIDGSGGTPLRNIVGGKFGGDCLQFGAGVTVRTRALHPSATVSFWYSLNLASWNHYVYRSASASWYVDGVAGSAPTGITLAYDATYGWTFANATGATRYIDDLWVCPYDWPATWPAYVYGYNLPVGLAPKLKADGLFIGAGVLTLDALGEVTSMPLLPGVVGSYAANLHTVDFSLREV
jgi:hypothetical protein